MGYLRELWLRLGWLANRSRFHTELADEIRFHTESRVEDLESEGMPRAEAEAVARREFGPKLKAAEDVSQAWQIRWLEDLLSDLRFAGRAMRRNPGFALTAVVCLALGIGANITVFNITTSFLFSEPSCRESARMISIWEGGNSGAPLRDYKLLRDAHIFDQMAGINVEREVNWREGDRTRRLYAGLVTDDLFTTLEPRFLLGRGIAPGETNTAVLAERVWRGALGSDASVLGRKLILDGRLYTVAGVLPSDHRSIVGFGISPDIYLPVLREDDNVQLYARMPQGMTIAIARARLGNVFQQFDRLYPQPDWKRGNQAHVTGVTGFDVLNQEIPGQVPAFFAMLLVVVGLVLLIACTNVASLLLARAANRSQELAIRLSLGASRRRIVRHLLAESLLLAALGMMAGLAIDVVCTRVVTALTVPLPVPIHLVASPDARVLWYSLGAALFSALCCGLLPALKAVKRDVNFALKQEEHQTARAWTLRSALVAGQLALSIVLLTTGFLFLHNLLRAVSMNPGFDIHRTIWAYMRLVPAKYEDAGQAKQTALVNLALERLRAVPGVESAAVTRRVPLNDNCVTGTQMRSDIAPAAIRVEYECDSAGPDYFRTLGIAMIRGRDFNATDRKGSRPTAIVNESFARTVFGDKDPVGHTITTDFTGDKAKLIVGVVKDSKYFTFTEKQRLAVYDPYFAYDEPINVHFLIRVSGVPLQYVRAINRVLGGLDATAAIETKPMSEALGLALLPSRAGAATLGTMGILGLLLAAIGLYGVLSYSVSQRRREIGVRVALGAAPGDVLRLVCRHSVVLAGGGLIAGLALAFFALQPLALFLVPGMSALDPAAFAAVAGVMCLVTIAATLAPVARALGVDPMAALRYE